LLALANHLRSREHTPTCLTPTDMPNKSVPCLPLAAALIFSVTGTASAQAPAEASPANAAFEAGQWQQAVREFDALIEANPAATENGLHWLRIAQAQRGMQHHEIALQSLDMARDSAAPEAMVNLERARNLAAMGESQLALGALDAADHLGLRALSSIEEAEEFAALRMEARFQRVYNNVRSRIYPCEGIPAASQFDFWLGEWEVRRSDGTVAGQSIVSKRDGGCSVVEDWIGFGGSSATSISYFIPSRDQWRQLWVGSGGTLIDMVGSATDGGMRLEGTIEYAGQDQVVAFRGTWTVLEDGSIRQHLEEFSLVLQGWNAWFDGYYRPQTAP
jgi:hypothetical protein